MTRKKKKNKSDRLGIAGICLVVAIFGVVMFMQSRSSSEEIKKLKSQEEKLEQELSEEQERSTRLEEQKIYVKTKKYVEEMAKKLGLVYPDEIIYRPSDD